MRYIIFLAAAFSLFVVSSKSHAQSPYAQTELNRINSVSNPNSYTANRLQTQVLSQAVPRYTAATPNLIAGALGRPNKPFSSISKGPSVTPYLALDQPFINSGTQYYTQVRPQLEQQRVNQQMQREAQLMQRQISEVQSRPPYDPQGSQYMTPTGHAAGFMTMSNFMNYAGYYQQARPQRR